MIGFTMKQRRARSLLCSVFLKLNVNTMQEGYEEFKLKVLHKVTNMYLKQQDQPPIICFQGEQGNNKLLVLPSNVCVKLSPLSVDLYIRPLFVANHTMSP